MTQPYLHGKRLLIFDIDGTLADRETGELLPGVAEWFEKNADQYTILMASNQGGVGLRHWMEEGGFGEPEKYPTEADIEARFTKVLEQLGPEWVEEAPIYVCYAYQSKKTGNWAPTPEGRHDPAWYRDWRKPAPGMFLEAMKYASATPQRTLAIGDREEDLGAAKAARIDFIWADVFFGRKRGE